MEIYSNIEAITWKSTHNTIFTWFTSRGEATSTGTVFSISTWESKTQFRCTSAAEVFRETPLLWEPFSIDLSSSPSSYSSTDSYNSLSQSQSLRIVTILLSEPASDTATDMLDEWLNQRLDCCFKLSQTLTMFSYLTITNRPTSNPS